MPDTFDRAGFRHCVKHVADSERLSTAVMVAGRYSNRRIAAARRRAMLLILEAVPGVCPKQLADFFGMSRSGISAALRVAEMEAAQRMHAL